MKLIYDKHSKITFITHPLNKPEKFIETIKVSLFGIIINKSCLFYPFDNSGNSLFQHYHLGTFMSLAMQNPRADFLHFLYLPFVKP